MTRKSSHKLTVSFQFHISLLKELHPVVMVNTGADSLINAE